MRSLSAVVLICALNIPPAIDAQPKSPAAAPFVPPTSITGFRDADAELQAEKAFLAVPDAALAKEHLKNPDLGAAHCRLNRGQKDGGVRLAEIQGSWPRRLHPGIQGLDESPRPTSKSMSWRRKGSS